MREFVFYTLLRLLLFVATFAVVSAVWILAAGELNWFWAVIVSFVLSGLASLVLLNRPRQAFAQKVETRASRTMEALRSKEDSEEPR